MWLIRSPPSPRDQWTGIRSRNGADSLPSLTQGSVDRDEEHEWG